MPAKNCGHGGPPCKIKKVQRYNLLHFLPNSKYYIVLKIFERFTLYKPPVPDLTHKLHLIAVPLGNLESP